MWWLVACQHPVESVSTWYIGEERLCEKPVAELTLSEEGEARGLSVPVGDPLLPNGIGSVVVEDLDEDGDLDLVYGDISGAPRVFENDGSGFFSEVAEPISSNDHPENLNVAVVEINGDRLPELLLFSGKNLLVAENLGGMQWDMQSPVLMLEVPYNITAVAAGDLDGDGDLDLVVPSGGENSDDQGQFPILLKNEDGKLVFWKELDAVGPLISQAPLLTDIDGDGDLDIYLANDLVGISTLWLNKGGEFTEAARDYGLSLDQAGMGMDSADLNGDGRLDYCFSNVGPMFCLLSSAAGGFYEGAQALGLVPADSVGHSGTIGWSVVLDDLDNDGDLDVLQASGEHAEKEGPIYRDLLWERGSDGFFTDTTVERGFGDTYNHVGMVAADFDGDGSLEVVLGNPEMRPLFYQNTCTGGAWLAVELEGPPENPFGIGARVELRAGGKTQVREVYGLKSHGQGASVVHFGLGEVEEVEEVVVRWPAGKVQAMEGVGVRREITAVWE